MNVATPQSPKTRPQRLTTTRPVPEILLELAYRLHVTKAVASRPATDWRPRKSR